jgi:hypothetical protein
MLFRRDSDVCLKSKTVLMLTHDVEPIIDTTKSLARKFGNQTSASFLKYSAGQITECPISRGDIQPFSQICRTVLSSARHDIVKLIYLRRRLEISSEMEDAYQVASNLLHKRTRAVDMREALGADGCHPDMDVAKFLTGCAVISEDLPGFSYRSVLTQVTDNAVLRMLYNASTNGYEKLQIFRLLNPEVENSVIQKFINETYHIENEFICQLDPSKFDIIPEYVILECDRMLSI